MKLAFALPVIGTSAVALAVALRKFAATAPNEYDEKLDEMLRRYKEQLIASPERLAEVQAEFIAQMKDGLAKRVVVDGKRMMMLPTFVTRLPDGTETGECFALDLGGTNFRVMYVRLGPGKGEVAAVEVQEVSLPREIYTGPGDKLFDYLATTLKAFIEHHAATAKPAHADIPKPDATSSLDLPVLGFCFSFAVEQDGLASGRLLDWTKGFSCPGVVGNDPVALLSAALERAGRPCRVAALLNDTVGVLAAQRYLDSDTEVGVIIGTGTNACYVENLSAMTKWTAPAGAAAGGDGRTAVNMEWGAFFSPQLPRCMEDLQVDAASPHPGKYLFEKLLSGMFLGEAARRILLTFARECPGLFPPSPTEAAVTTIDGGLHIGVRAIPGAAAAGSNTALASLEPSLVLVPERLATAGSLSSAALAAIVEDRSWGLRITRQLLTKELGVHKPSMQAAAVAREVCTLIARRSAQLTAMGLVAVLTHNGWIAATPPRPVTVAFDGGVYERFGAYRTMLSAAVEEQLGQSAPELAPRIKFVLSHDGSALGAAVLAAAAVAGEAAAAVLGTKVTV